MDDDDDHSQERQFREVLAERNFADRYYAYCAAHPNAGPDIPLALQIEALNESGRTFRYHKKENFFAWRDPQAPEGCELGMNLILKYALAEWVLVFKTPSGHLGNPLSSVAQRVKWLTQPGYRHEPHAAKPGIANAKEFARVLEEGLALYDDIAKAIAPISWA